ncbi:MAG: hypothetical protein NC102_07385 [Clostridium sp.]|nr:hypothetical protein [Clostridium sp.]
MKTYVLAIGGTGARVLRSLTMLMAAGAGVNKPNENGERDSDSVNEVVPVIIDYDIDNGDTNRTQDLLMRYKWIHDQAYGCKNKEEDIRNFFFGTEVNRIDSGYPTRFEVYLNPVDTKATFADYVGYESINADNGTEATSLLLQSLYDTSDSDSNLAELNLNLKVGFKGCPNIGCIVMRDLQDSKEISHIINMSDNARVMIVGSVFGGTGASGIPVILEAIKKGSPTTKVGILAMEPYFEVQKDKKSAISSSTFLSKTKAAFDAYKQGGDKSVNSLADAIYYVGDRLASQAYENSEGGKSQKNDAHIAELLAAMCIMDFSRFENEFPEHKFHVVKLTDKGGVSESAGGEEMAEPFNYDSFPEKTLRNDYIDPLCRLAILTTYCDTFLRTEKKWGKSVVWAAPTQSDFCDETEFMNRLFSFLDEFKRWAKELENPMHPLRLFDFSEGYGKLFVDLTNKRKAGLFGGLANVIDNDSDVSINAVLNKIYNNYKNKEHLKGQNKLMFFKYAGEATQQMLDRVLEVTNRTNPR